MTRRRVHRPADLDPRVARSLLEHLPGIAYVDDPGGTGRWVSPQVSRILGYTPDEWLEHPELWEKSLHPDDRERARSQRSAGAVPGGAYTSAYRVFTRDGRVVWIRDQARVVVDPSGATRVHGVMFDVTHERGVEAELELEIAERAAIAQALQRLPAALPSGEAAAAICSELLRLRHLDIAAVYEFSDDEAVVPLAVIAPPGAPSAAGRPLPPDRARYLRESATGPWVDEWHRTPEDDAYRSAWLDAGLTCSAYVPFGSSGVTYGLISAGTTSMIGAAGVSRWLPALTEFGAITAAMLVPELAARRERAGVRASIRSLIREHAFAPVYQPIVRLSDRSVVGYEALTRFHDGGSPEAHFGEADSVGMGDRLELACVRAAIVEGEALPKGPFLSLNLSPSLMANIRTKEILGEKRKRNLVLEITERSAIEDYDAIRHWMENLPSVVEVAVDDAGAGFASLRHIIELRPRYVKLDMQLVRGVAADPARQALIAGMVYFARQSGCLLIAEGVESEAERAVLSRLGVPFGQGFLFARPAPALALRAMRASEIAGGPRRVVRPARASSA